MARVAKLVAVYRGVTLAELLTEFVRPLAAKALEEEQAKQAKRGRAGEPR